MTYRERQQRAGRQRHRVQPDLQAGVGHAVRDRHHRQAGAHVVVAPVHRQRPEVRRGPHEDDQDQQPGLHRHVVGDRGPAQRRRHRAGQTADHDVLRRVRLEQDGVDQRVAHERHEGQPHRERIDHAVQHTHAGAADDGGKDQGLGGRQLAHGGRAARGARHAGVDLGLDQAVDGEGGAGQQPDAERRPDQHVPAGETIGGEEHADHGAEHGQLRDARLGQGPVLRDPAGRVFMGGGLGNHEWLAETAACDCVAYRLRSS